MPGYIKSFASDLLHATERAESSDGRICKLDSINSALVNLYLHKSGSTALGRHYDSPHIFKRPILSLRLFNACELSFGHFTNAQPV